MRCGANGDTTCMARQGSQCMEHLITDTPSCPSRVPLTNADRIRAMSDEELATWILENIDCDKENIMCCPELYRSSGKCNGRCIAGRLNWLKQG